MNKKTSHSIGYNFLYNLIYQIVNILVQVILLRYLSIVIGSEGIGIQSYTSSIVSYFTMFMALGINWYGQKEIAQRENARTALSDCFWALVLLKMLWAIAVVPLYILLVLTSGDYKVYYIVSALMLLATLLDISWFYQGIERFDVVALRNIAVKLIGMFLVFALVKREEDVLKYIFILSMSNLLGNLSMWIRIRGIINPVVLRQMNLMDMKLHFKAALQYFIPTIATTLYLTIDKTMIGFICKNPSVNGYYEQAIQIANMLKTIVFSYNSVMISRMSSSVSQNLQKSLKELFSNSLEFISFISWPIMLGFLALERDFCLLYFGAEYNEIADILLFFSPVIFIVGLSNMVESHIVTPMNHRKTGNKIVVEGLIVNVLLNSILIPSLGGTGAAIASVISEIFVTINYVRRYPDYVNWKKIFKVSAKKSIASILMYVGIMIVRLYFETGILALCTEIFLGAVAYLCLLCLFKDSYMTGIIRLIKRKAAK